MNTEKEADTLEKVQEEQQEEMSKEDAENYRKGFDIGMRVALRAIEERLGTKATKKVLNHISKTLMKIQTGIDPGNPEL